MSHDIPTVYRTLIGGTLKPFEEGVALDEQAGMRLLADISGYFEENTDLCDSTQKYLEELKHMIQSQLNSLQKGLDAFADKMDSIALNIQGEIDRRNSDLGHLILDVVPLYRVLSEEVGVEEGLGDYLHFEERLMERDTQVISSLRNLAYCMDVALGRIQQRSRDAGEGRG